MKTKLITSLLIAAASTAFAQTDNATLNVRLYPIQSIIVNPTQKTVNLDYKTTSDYSEGVTSNQANHLTTYSTGGFVVKVKSSTASLVGQKSNIDANDIDITPSAGNIPLNNAQYQSRKLSNQDQIIITSQNGAINKTFNVSYKASGADKYIDKVFKGDSPSIYTTVVSYTIEAN